MVVDRLSSFILRLFFVGVLGVLGGLMLFAA
jgi:hypothetical protein